MPITGEQLRQLMNSSNTDDDFKTKLKESSDKFIEMFEEWVEKKAIEIAHRGNRSNRFANCKYPLAFNQRLNGFRISTYIKGFRTANGEFDTSHFRDLEDYSDELPTPFEKARHSLQERGIYVQDISDPMRGLGFWVKISF